MDQISPPMRIVLVVAVLFAVAWFTVLKPKDPPQAAGATAGPIPTATAAGLANDPNGPTANSGLGRAVQKARGAGQQQQDADTRSGSTSAAATATATPNSQSGASATPTPRSGAGAAPATPASPAATLAKVSGLPRDIAGGLARKEVVVLLFWDRGGSDDRAVREAVRGLGRPGKVLVHAAPVSKVARYTAITQGVDVSRSPSVVVVDRKLQAQLLPGYQSRDSIRQAIADARRASA